MSNTPSEKLDARGLNCPVPVLRTSRKLNGMKSGELLEVITSDQGSLEDLSAFCQQTGNELLESTDKQGEFVFLLRKT